MTLLRISAEQTVPLRHAILRPSQPREACRYPGDDATETAHFGVLIEKKIVGIATVYHEPPPGEQNPGAWRLRGMAVEETMRRNGCGKALLQMCLNHIAAQGGTRLWFNARSSSVAFYEKFGFVKCGDEFVLPGIGPHFFMSLELPRF